MNRENPLRLLNYLKTSGCWGCPLKHAAWTWSISLITYKYCSHFIDSEAACTWLFKVFWIHQYSQYTVKYSFWTTKHTFLNLHAKKLICTGKSELTQIASSLAILPVFSLPDMHGLPTGTLFISGCFYWLYILVLCSYFKEPVFSPASNIVHTRLNLSMGRFVDRIAIPIKSDNVCRAFMTKESAKKCGVQFPWVFCFARSAFVTAALFLICRFLLSSSSSWFLEFAQRYPAKNSWYATISLQKRRFDEKPTSICEGAHSSNALASISEYPLSSPGLEEMCNHLFFA